MFDKKLTMKVRDITRSNNRFTRSHGMVMRTLKKKNKRMGIEITS